MMIKKTDKQLALKLYRDMVRVRTFDEKASDLFTKAMLSGNIHTCIGQEATAVGGCAALNPGDFISATHRGHGQCLAKGADPKIMMAELFGKSTGYCRGKGGSMHIADFNTGILGANGIVGAGIPMGVGSALASKYMKKDEVTLIYFGDGASNTGEFHESLNMASAWNLPAVFLCENNKYGVSVCIDRVCKIENIAIRGIAYDIPGKVVDGNDVFEVYEAVQKAAERARKGEGPTLIEAKTYRHHGHFEGDPQIYKNKEEIEDWLQKDPIKLLRAELIKAGLSTEKDLDKIDEEARLEMEEAARFGADSPFPAPEEVTMDVYAADNERSVAR